MGSTGFDRIQIEIRTCSGIVNYPLKLEIYIKIVNNDLTPAQRKAEVLNALGVATKSVAKEALVLA